MTPCLTPDYVANIFVGYSKSCAYFCVGKCGCLSKAANLTNIVLGYLGVAVGFAPSFSKNMGKMQAIFRARDVFKVFNEVVFLVSVLVVYLQTFWARAEKSERNKPMGRVDSAVFAEPILRVSAEANARAQDASGNVARTTLNVSKPTLIAYLVFSFKADNWFPSFTHSTPH